MAHTYSKRGASTSAGGGGKANGGDSATAKEEDYSPNHVVYKKVDQRLLTIVFARSLGFRDCCPRRLRGQW